MGIIVINGLIVPTSPTIARVPIYPAGFAVDPGRAATAAAADSGAG